MYSRRRVPPQLHWEFLRPYLVGGFTGRVGARVSRPCRDCTAACISSVVQGQGRCFWLRHTSSSGCHQVLGLLQAWLATALEDDVGTLGLVAINVGALEPQEIESVTLSVCQILDLCDTGSHDNLAPTGFKLDPAQNRSWVSPESDLLDRDSELCLKKFC